MEYIIADLHVSVPDSLVTGHFARALAPFAVEAPSASEKGIAERDMVQREEVVEGQNVTEEDVAGPGTVSRRQNVAERDVVLRAGECPPPGPDYRETDRFDFSDADAACRFGRDTAGCLLEMTPRDGSATARFRMRADSPVVTTDYTLRHHPALLRFGLWTACNIAALRRTSVAIHSSALLYRGQAVLFLGESGTGKSTHTRLWREHIPGAELLNDDSPFVRIAGSTRSGDADTGPDAGATVAPRQNPEPTVALACGSPWSGKTPCYRNECYPIRAFVRLAQAPHNRIRRLGRLEAIGALLPSCPPAFAHDQVLFDRVCETVSQLLARVEVYRLECLPDAAAARLVCQTLFKDETDRQ